MSKQEKLLAEKTVGLKPSGIRRFFDLVSEMKDAISLGVGEPDFDTPWHIRDEGIYSLPHFLHLQLRTEGAEGGDRGIYEEDSGHHL